MHRLFKFKYPKITLLIVISIAAYFLFNLPEVSEFFLKLNGLSYLGIFIAGLLFSFGFTTPLAIGIFIVSAPENILLAAIIGGFGAMLSDITIFKIIRFSFMDEFNRLEKTHPAKIINAEIKKEIPKKIRNYLLYFLAGLIIASPLPDEVGVTMLAGLSHIKTIYLAIIGLIFNTLGIFVMLLI
ncbi:MAG: hypothetical protein AABX11_04565 [Nanoarchaeota archaeon]